MQQSPRTYFCISCLIRLLGRVQGRLHMLMAQPLTNGRQTHSAVHKFSRSLVNPFVIYSLQPLSGNPCRIVSLCITTLASYAVDHSKGGTFP
jgi:hypothetical protein